MAIRSATTWAWPTAYSRSLSPIPRPPPWYRLSTPRYPISKAGHSVRSMILRISRSLGSRSPIDPGLEGQPLEILINLRVTLEGLDRLHMLSRDQLDGDLLVKGGGLVRGESLRGARHVSSGASRCWATAKFWKRLPVLAGQCKGPCGRCQAIYHSL